MVLDDMTENNEETQMEILKRLGQVREVLSTKYKCLYNQLSEQQLLSVLNSPHTHKMQPLSYLLNAVCLGGQRREIKAERVLNNIERGCLHAINGGANAWLSQNLSLACNANESKYSNAAAALAELRAFGALASIDATLQPIKRKRSPTPDFELKFDTYSVYIEVACKQMNDNEADRLKDFFAQPPNSSGGFSIRSTVVQPFGAAKGDESVGENVAQKLSGIKPHAKQAAEENCSILWLDLQDEDMKFVSASACVPMMVFKEQWFSTGLWHAFYGTKGLPIFEEYIPFRSLPPREQNFLGMFEQTHLWSAVILSFDNEIILLENPWARNHLEFSLKEFMVKLPSFNPSLSWMGWDSIEGQEKLRQVIYNERNRLHTLGHLARAPWIRFPEVSKTGT